MFVGASIERLKKENMPMHEEVVAYAQELKKHLPDYEIVAEHISSRVVMLAKKKFKRDGKWFTWIDFERYHELVNSGQDFTTDDYLKETPATALSGKKTSDFIPKRARRTMMRKKTLEQITMKNH